MTTYEATGDELLAGNVAGHSGMALGWICSSGMTILFVGVHGAGEADDDLSYGQQMTDALCRPLTSQHNNNINININIHVNNRSSC